MAAYNQIEIFEQSQKWFDQLPLEWKNWLEENLEKGCGVEQLVDVLKANGFEPRYIRLVLCSSTWIGLYQLTNKL